MDEKKKLASLECFGQQQQVNNNENKNKKNSTKTLVQKKNETKNRSIDRLIVKKK